MDNGGELYCIKTRLKQLSSESAKYFLFSNLTKGKKDAEDEKTSNKPHKPTRMLNRESNTDKRSGDWRHL